MENKYLANYRKNLLPDSKSNVAADLFAIEERLRLKEKREAEAVELNQRLLAFFSPVNQLTEDHLNTLLRNRSIEYLFAGQKLFELGDTDDCCCYLLHGELTLTDADGRERIAMVADSDHNFPVGHHQPRRHTATALTDCSIVRFDNTELDNMLCWDQTANAIMSDIAAERDFDEDAQWMMTLLKSNLFYRVPPMNIRQILDRFEPIYVPQGQVILRQGELGDCCYIIKEGSAEVFQSQASNRRPEKVATLTTGRCFGEEALVSNFQRNATVKMAENGVLMQLGKNDFFRLLKHPSVKTLGFSAAQETFPEGDRWIDVRTMDEYDRGHAPAAINIPLTLIKLKSRMLDKDLNYIAYCNSGKRSEAAVSLLEAQGFTVLALREGMDVLNDEQLEFFRHRTAKR